MVMIKYNKKLTPKAKELRKEMTKEENQLWYNFLRNYPVRFRRQKVIGNYIADFYCSKAKLIVEIDGKHHKDNNIMENDKLRSEYLNSIDIKVIRFENDEVINSFNSLCTEIDETVKRLLKP